MTYWRIHSCSIVAETAQSKLTYKLKIQNVLAQIEYKGGEKGGGCATADGIDGLD
jgi:hypothetical protein